MKKIILVDGNNLLFRSYYATSYSGVIMRNSKGFPTNALYGFINMMHKIIEEEQPTYILVAFDKGKTFRHEKYDDYKAGRKQMPEELKEQFPKAKEILDAMGIKHFETDNYEADDIIGTLAKNVDEEDEFNATIISSDKDLLQLISKEVDVKLLKTKGFIRFDEQTFEEVYGIKPIRMIDLKALMGDASDNIPGVKGIGEKTALQLLKQYNTLDNLYQNLDSLTPKTKEKLQTDQEKAYMSYDLATIYKEVPIPFSLEDCKYNGLRLETYQNLLLELEFKSLLKKLPTSPKEELLNQSTTNFQLVETANFDFTKSFSFYIEMDGYYYHHAAIIGVGFTNATQTCFMTLDEIKQRKDIFENNTPKFTYNIKKSFILLHKLNINLNNCHYDAMIASYLLDYQLDDDITKLMHQMTSTTIASYEETYGTEKRRKEVTLEQTKQQCIEKSNFIYESKETLEVQIAKNNETTLLNEIEIPLTYVLADMELTGITIDQVKLNEMKNDLEAKMTSLEKEIYQTAGVTFNIMSPRQLGQVLFETLALPYPQKRKNKDTSYSTSKDILDKIKYFHPIVQMVLDYRTLAKLYTNYAVGLLEEVQEDNKIHTIFNQCLTRTGRLSSNKPNLQNIPIRSNESKLIRKAFTPEENCLLMTSDYSQIELRVFAHLSNAQNLIQAFNENKDIHAQTAADIYHIPIDSVTKTMRRTAKAVNFGILYGISSFGLSEDLKINVQEAKHFINNYLETYPGIKEYMETEIQEAYKNGYVTTIMNRKRTIEELKNKNYMIRMQGERMALNTPIQGSAADILKKAMVDLYQEMKKRNLKSKMLIQVHDELIFNVYQDELEQMRTLVKEKMEQVVNLKIPLKVDIEVGKDWYEAK